MGVTEERMFSNDEFNPHKFSEPERNYLIEHMGETPRQAFAAEATQFPVNRAGMQVALQRLFEEREDVGLMIKLRECLALANDVDNIKREQTRRFGSIDYGAMNVGCGVGQTGIERHFVVDLSSKVARSKGDPLKGLRQKFAGEDVDVVTPKISALPCAWCDYIGEGSHALAALRMHIQRSHPDRRKLFKKTIAPALKDGDVGPLMEAAERHDADQSPVDAVDPADIETPPDAVEEE